MGLYSRVLEHVLLPSYESIRGYKHCARRAFVEKSQWWSADRLLEQQRDDLQRLLRHAFDTVPFYRERFRAAGAAPEDFRNLDDLRRLPPLTRQDIIANRESLCSSAYAGRLLPHATGGSSGMPLRFYITRESFEWRCAVSERAYAWTGSRLGDRTLYLWGAPVGPQSRKSELKMRLFRTARRERMFSTFSQNEALWGRIYSEAQSWRPQLLVGYVSSLEEFCRWLLATGKAKTLPSITAAIAAAEPVYERTRELVRDALGAPLFNTYGSREFMSIAAECDRHNGLHVHSENLLVETETGSGDTPSALLVTDLHNLGMPFIRYRIGDLATMDTRPCDCGRGLPRIRSIEGRELDALRTADGRIVPGEFFPHVLKDLPEVGEFQVRQEAIDRIRLLVVLSGELSEKSAALLRHEVEKVFGGSTQLMIERVEEIPALKSGKRRVTVGLDRPA
jgi:phenylacetate-CoA ligase